MGATSSEAGRTRPSRPLRDVRRRHVLPGKKRSELVGKTKRGKGTKIMVLADRHGIPLGATIARASPHEMTLIEPLLNGRVIHRRPQRLICDLAADSDPLRERLAQRGIELVCPHRRNRKRRLAAVSKGAAFAAKWLTTVKRLGHFFLPQTPSA